PDKFLSGWFARAGSRGRSPQPRIDESSPLPMRSPSRLSHLRHQGQAAEAEEQIRKPRAVPGRHPTGFAECQADLLQNEIGEENGNARCDADENVPATGAGRERYGNDDGDEAGKWPGEPAVQFGEKPVAHMAIRVRMEPQIIHNVSQREVCTMGLGVDATVGVDLDIAL